MNPHAPSDHFDFEEVDMNADGRYPVIRVVGTCGLCGHRVSRETARAAELAADDHIALEHSDDEP